MYTIRRHDIDGRTHLFLNDVVEEMWSLLIEVFDGYPPKHAIQTFMENLENEDMLIPSSELSKMEDTNLAREMEKWLEGNPVGHWTDSHIRAYESEGVKVYQAFDEVGLLHSEHDSRDEARDALVVYTATELRTKEEEQ